MDGQTSRVFGVLRFIFGFLILSSATMVAVGLYNGDYWAGIGLAFLMTTVLLFIVSSCHDENRAESKTGN